MNRVIIPVAFLLAVVSISVRGQWRIVAPNLTTVSQFYGGMCFNEGIVWIANCNETLFYDSLYVSTDTGITWTRKPLPDLPYDIEFYDSLNGV